jgi:L-fuculokinase
MVWIRKALITGHARLTARYTVKNMSEKLVIVLDCGATNVRAVAVDTKGRIIAMHNLANATRQDPDYQTGLIWDLDEIWNKACTCTKAVSEKINIKNLTGLTVTTFGVNGAPVNKQGKLLYPVISWQCQRTVPLMEKLESLVPFPAIYGISGVYRYSFNTIYTLLWLKENHPEVLDRMEGFLFISSLILNRLCGSFVNDITMAGTSMLTDIRRRVFSEELLSLTGLPDKFFKLAEAGTFAGVLTRKSAVETGLPYGIPVISGGHDTQFSLLGSGAGENEAVLSSGTWEILMTRTKHIELNCESIEGGLTHELDIVPGLYNTGTQWLASGVIEWIKNSFYPEVKAAGAQDIYELMIKEGSDALKHPGSVKFIPELTEGRGCIEGIGLHTTRGQIYLAALTCLAAKTKSALEQLQLTGKFKASALIIAGGGARNRLWNRLRAEKLGIPLKLVKQKETTVLGAAVCSFVSLGVFSDFNEGVHEISKEYEYVYPGQG